MYLPPSTYLSLAQSWISLPSLPPSSSSMCMPSGLVYINNAGMCRQISKCVPMQWSDVYQRSDAYWQRWTLFIQISKCVPSGRMHIRSLVHINNAGLCLYKYQSVRQVVGCRMYISRLMHINGVMCVNNAGMYGRVPIRHGTMRFLFFIIKERTNMVAPGGVYHGTKTRKTATKRTNIPTNKTKTNKKRRRKEEDEGGIK